MSSACCSAVDSVRLEGQSILATDATQTPRNSRAKGGATSLTTGRRRAGIADAERPGVLAGVGRVGSALAAAGWAGALGIGSAGVGGGAVGRHASIAHMTTIAPADTRSL